MEELGFVSEIMEPWEIGDSLDFSPLLEFVSLHLLQRC